MNEGLLAALLAAAFPGAEAGEDECAGGDHERGQGEAERLDRGVVRFEPAPVARLQDAEHDQRQTGRREHAPHPVEARCASLPFGLADQFRPEQDSDRDDHLADEDQPPGEVGGHPSTEDRADRDAGAGDPAEDAVGDRSVRSLVVAGDQRDHRRQDQRRADPLQDRPAERQRGHAPGGGGQPRPDAVDAEADREGPSPPPDVAELAAGQHQPRHHQRVEGDHRLDRRHRGVEVVDQLGDRDVHHGLIEHHQELGGRQDREDSPLGHGRDPTAAEGA